MSLKEDDEAAGKVAVAQRVTLADIENKIIAEYFFTLDKAVQDAPIHDSLKIFTIAVIVMQNGFLIIGESAPAAPENFNAELGRKLAREQALRKVWMLEGYLLREKLSAKTG